MGTRKRIKAEKEKEAKKTLYFAKLNNCPTSPRKMRLVADLVRGVNVEHALNILAHSTKQPSDKLHKLLKSAIKNWENKNEGVRIEESNLYVSDIFVDAGRVLKRIQPAPQGRAHRVKKRSNHVTLFIDSRNTIEEEITPAPVEEKTEEVVETKVKKVRSKKNI
jgi:large subunit ribosomal protein L22